MYAMDTSSAYVNYSNVIAEQHIPQNNTLHSGVQQLPTLTLNFCSHKRIAWQVCKSLHSVKECRVSMIWYSAITSFTRYSTLPLKWQGNISQLGIQILNTYNYTIRVSEPHLRIACPLSQGKTFQFIMTLHLWINNDCAGSSDGKKGTQNMECHGRF